MTGNETSYSEYDFSEYALCYSKTKNRRIYTGCVLIEMTKREGIRYHEQSTVIRRRLLLAGPADGRPPCPHSLCNHHCYFLSIIQRQEVEELAELTFSCPAFHNIGTINVCENILPLLLPLRFRLLFFRCLLLRWCL